MQTVKYLNQLCSGCLLLYSYSFVSCTFPILVCAVSVFSSLLPSSLVCLPPSSFSPSLYFTHTYSPLPLP